VKVGFVGLGKLGLPCAEQIASRHEVIGYDIAPRTSTAIRIAADLAGCVAGCRLVFLAVPTPHAPSYDGSQPSAHLPNRDFDYRAVSDLLETLNGLLDRGQLVVLISTVLPGTIRAHLAPHARNYRFIYNPYFIAMGSVAWDMVNPEMVLIGTEDGESTQDALELIDFYGTLMQNDPRYVVGTWEEAEAIKLFYNTYISLKLSFVNMIQDVAERIGSMNVDVVTDALASSRLRITGPKYMRAGMGDAGPCHPRDNIALRFLAERLHLGYDLFDAIMASRETQAMHLAECLVHHARESGLPIVIHGKSYKPDVPYTDGSYSLLVGHFCTRMGCPPVYVDPLTGDMATQELGTPPRGVFLLAHNPQVTFKYTGRPGQRAQYCEFGAGSIVVDPWRECGPIPGVHVIHYGNTRGRDIRVP
jgi:UDPglucose 6-dehydrogenase